jgi:signal transduction histidine kinase
LINLAKQDKAHNVKTLYLEMIEKSARQQDYFIREILDQSRNSRLEVKSEPVLFEALIEETFEQFKFPNGESRLETVIHVDQSAPFYTDKWRLKIILNNLISNSIRYKNGEAPVIRIDAKINDHKVTLSVADNGKGISKEHIPNLGKMFYRATDDGAGSGLGLYIVKEALGRLNGSWDIKSTIGQGTQIDLEIPEVLN